MAEQPYSGEDPIRALKRKRPVFFKELGGFVETPCYDGDKLQHGNTMTGPAIIEEKTTTLVVPPKARIRVDRFGNYFGKLE
jgi:N-methylhydantoinase A